MPMLARVVDYFFFLPQCAIFIWNSDNCHTTFFLKEPSLTIPYADPRAYTDRLNALFSPRGWTREYKVETMGNITRMKKGKSIMPSKVLVTCTVTIIGLWSHSGTGEEWADDDKGMTSADAQAFKRACSCFGLGRYFYDIPPIWVDLDQNRQPLRTPVLSAWALPEKLAQTNAPTRQKWRWAVQVTVPRQQFERRKRQSRERSEPAREWQRWEPTRTACKDEWLACDKYRRRPRPENFGDGESYRHCLLPQHLARIRSGQPAKADPGCATKRKVLQVLESATRGFGRLEAVTKRLEPKTVEALLAKIQAPPIDNIADIITLQSVVLGLEEMAGLSPTHGA